MLVSWLACCKRTFLPSLVRAYGSGGTRQYRPRRSGYQPLVERLENRTLPSTIPVTITADSGTGSLRAALANAQAGDTIDFDLGPGPHTIGITSGSLVINTTLTITGPGDSLLIVDGSGLTSSGAPAIFFVQSKGQATISGLTIANGKQALRGDGVFDSGILTLQSAAVTSNIAGTQGQGGGVFVSKNATLMATSTTFSKNGTGPGSGVAGRGGAIFATSAAKVSLSKDHFTSNTAKGGANGGSARGGGVYWKGGGTFSLRQSVFLSNVAQSGAGKAGADGAGPNGNTTGRPGGSGGSGGNGGSAIGGGIFFQGTSSLMPQIIGNNFQGNKALGAVGGRGGAGGAGSKGSRNRDPGGRGGAGGIGGAGGDALGGGIYWAGSNAIFDQDTWSGNKASGGAGNQGGKGGKGGTGARISESGSFGGTGGVGGGAGAGGTGGAGAGGGVYWAGGTATITRATFSNNAANSGAGGSGGTGGTGGTGGMGTEFGASAGAAGQAGDGGNAGLAQGGGLFWSAGSLTLTVATLSNNLTAAEAGGNGGTGGHGGNGGRSVDLIWSNGGNATRGTPGGTGGTGGSAEGGSIFAAGANVTIGGANSSNDSASGGHGGNGGNGGDGGNGAKGVLRDGNGGDGGNSGNGGGGGNAFGGAAFSAAKNLTITNSSIQQARAASASGGTFGSKVGQGGTGHLNGGHSGSLGSNGSAGQAGGGGLYLSVGPTTLLGLTLSNNQAVSSALSYGGAIFASSYLAMTNSTVAANSADHGGGLDVHNQSDTQGGYSLLLTNCTIAGNAASALGGGLNFEDSPVALANTIVANNMGPTDSNGPDLFGYVAVSLADDILVGTPSGSGYKIAQSQNNNQLGVDPHLGPLQNNGGPTQTMALLFNSPAINAGDNNAIPAGIIDDQRGTGYVRIFDNIVDLGAYEYQPFSTALALASGQMNPTSQSPINFTVTFGAAVNSFTSGNVTLTGTAGANQAAVSGSGTTFTVAVSGMTQSGSVIVSVPGDAVTDGLRNPNAPSDIVTVTYTVPTPLGPTQEYAASVPVGSPPTVPVIDATTGATLFTLSPFPAAFTGGVNVVVGCGLIVTGAGAGGAPMVNVYNSSGTLLFNFFAFDPSFTGGVTLAVGYLHGDTVPYVIVGAGVGGGPAVNVYNGQTGALVDSFFAFDPSFTGGVTVAAGDVTGNGAGDIIVGAGLGGGPVVAVFSGQNPGMMLHEFFAFDPSFTGGVTVAAEDVNLDGHADILVGAGPGGGAFVIAYDGATLAVLDSFFAYAGSLGGVRVAQGGFNSAGQALIRTGQGPGTSTNGAQNFNALLVANLDSFFAFDPHAGKFMPFAPP